MTLPPPETDRHERRRHAPAEDHPTLLRGTGRPRRRAGSRSRRLDVAIGLLVGALAVVAVPGIALAGIGAAVVLLIVGLSLAYRRTRMRGRARRQRARR